MPAILLFLLGLIALLAGICLLPKGLEALGQSQIQRAVTRFTATPLTGLLTGTVVTALIQSSTAVTVISIGLVGRRLMTLSQGISIILGTNIGTTITAQVIAFDFTAFSPWLIGIGLLFRWLPIPKSPAFSQAFLGLGLIFGGLYLLETAFTPWRNSPMLLYWLGTLGNNYFLALITGIVVTGVLQSSSAVIGLTLVLGQEGLLPLTAAIAIMLGSNLGTCVTAILAASAGTIDARRIALAHFLLNAGGALVFFPLIDFFAYFLTFTANDLPRQIANSHTIYNMICSLMVLPIIDRFTWLIRKLLPDN